MLPMGITTAVKAVARVARTGYRAFRIAIRAARILASDRQLPLILRLLFVVGMVQIPCLPTDELALAVALLWLFLRYRARLRAAFAAARADFAVR